MAVEVVSGILAHSLALLSDAAHMLTDAGALGAGAGRAAAGARARPRARMTYGLKRTEILSAQFNGATLLVLGLLIVYEGMRRLIEPPEVEGGVVLVVALVGVAVNVVATVVLHGADRTSLNVEGAFQHVLTDLVAFIATAIAGVVVLLTGFDRADGIASLFVAAVMLRAAWALLRDSGRIFLEAAPKEHRRRRGGRRDGRRAAACTEVHDLHVWEVTSGFPALSAHVLVGADDDCHRARHGPRGACCTTASGSSTRPCRSITRAETSSRSRSATELVLRPLQQRVEQQLVGAVRLGAVLDADAEHRHVAVAVLDVGDRGLAGDHVLTQQPAAAQDVRRRVGDRRGDAGRARGDRERRAAVRVQVGGVAHAPRQRVLVVDHGPPGSSPASSSSCSARPR